MTMQFCCDEHNTKKRMQFIHVPPTLHHIYVNMSKASSIKIFDFPRFIQQFPMYN